MDAFSLKGRTALVTGSSRGIGKSIAIALGLAGAKTILHGVRPSEKMEMALKEAQSLGIDATALYADLSKGENAEMLAREAENADIAVLNASTQSYGHIGDFDNESFDAMVDTNLRSSFILVKEFGKKMCARGFGRIIFIGSVNQAHPAPRLAIYASTKAAARALVLTAAKEYAPFGVTVNTITPGVIATDRNEEVLSDGEFSATLKKNIPLGRFGAPNDCAGAALLLASDAGSYITGADIVIDGGLSL